MSPYTAIEQSVPFRASPGSFGTKDVGIRTQIVPVSKPPSTSLPPQKVIRALNTSRSQGPKELPFKEGDFLYVLRDVDNPGGWYEAHNPVSGAQGLVPKDMFEEFNKNSVSVARHPSTYCLLTYLFHSLPAPQQLQVEPMSPKSTMKTQQVFYAIVLHNFFAECSDELDAKHGNAITVVAQSNREWFVAKPIGRLGRAGLIPVSFVEICDPSTGKAITNVDEFFDCGDLPKVEDWVPNTLFLSQYSPAAPLEPAVDEQRPSPHDQPYSDASIPPPNTLPDDILLSANVVSFHFEMNEYWFRVDAIFQPYAPSPRQALPPAKSLVLFRAYNNFYDFQVSLLDTFPKEAGRQPPNPRKLPYMLGPAQDVDDTLTAVRRNELNEYVRSLCELRNAGAKYILEHQVVREFLALKPGDVEKAIPPRVQEVDALFGRSQSQYDEVQDSLGKLMMDEHQSGRSDSVTSPIKN
ncbi:hypothetical protein C8R44DRAFT_937699 [Mycena epipterygia]|nr:hypothetical protein C8R44DRAFT_937699 [Mycena epipterygia]